MKVVFNTNGRGLWTAKRRAVEIVDMRLGYVNDEQDFGELCVYYNTATWETGKDGLIYTDLGWITDLQEFLNTHGLPGKDVTYSEQGMQGDDYVSLDVGEKFLSAWEAKFGQLVVE